MAINTTIIGPISTFIFARLLSSQRGMNGIHLRMDRTREEIAGSMDGKTEAKR